MGLKIQESRSWRINSQALPLRAKQAQRGDRGIALPLLDPGAGRRVVTPTPRPLYPRRRDPVPTAQGDGWTPGSVWTDAENFAPNGIRSWDHPDYSVSLIPAHYETCGKYKLILNLGVRYSFVYASLLLVKQNTRQATGKEFNDKNICLFLNESLGVNIVKQICEGFHRMNHCCVLPQYVV